MKLSNECFPSLPEFLLRLENNQTIKEREKTMSELSMQTSHRNWDHVPLELPALPWEKNALEPIISANTIDFHYGKHHKAYVDKTKELIAGTPLENKSIDEIIIATSGKPDMKTLYNNAAQVWNHDFYWKSLAAYDSSKPSEELLTLINRDFGSFEEFRKQLVAYGVGQFGSGWAWVVVENHALSLVRTPNADNPWTQTRVPILTLDVWEHAYYLDYQNRRQAYLEAVIDHLVNWDFMLENYRHG